MTLSTELPLFANNQDKPRIILLVEDDRAIQSLLQAGFRELSGYQVIIAGNGVEALEVLKSQTVHVIVTDLNMPVMDGFKLLSIIYEQYAYIPVLVMTGLANISHQNASIPLRVLRILPKPIKLSTLVERVKEAAENKPDGVVHGIPLCDFLQLIEWEHKSCTLVVEAEQNMGMLYLQNGVLVHASFNEFEGLDAAYNILSWAYPRVQVKNACHSPKTIHNPLTEMITNITMRKEPDDRLPNS